MCLYVKDIPEDLKPLTADKDIHVFKVLVRNEVSSKYNTKRYVYKTPFRGTIIPFNSWGKCIIEANMNGKYLEEITAFGYKIILNGRIKYIPKRKTTLISWKNGELEYDIEKAIADTCYLEIEDGIHAYTSFIMAAAKWPIIDFPCYEIHNAVIPKGAHYFIGLYDEIVADKMIIYKKRVKK